MNHIGLLAIELFITDDGKVLINELAPRPHNSGHLTIECCSTSQFEQHIRCILNLPLGETHIKESGIMINLVGEKGYIGTPKYFGIKNVFKSKNTKLYIYGKNETRPNRKMGHITIVGEDDLIFRGNQLKNSIRIIA